MSRLTVLGGWGFVSLSALFVACGSSESESLFGPPVLTQSGGASGGGGRSGGAGGRGEGGRSSGGISSIATGGVSRGGSPGSGGARMGTGGRSESSGGTSGGSGAGGNRASGGSTPLGGTPGSGGVGGHGGVGLAGGDGGTTSVGGASPDGGQGGEVECPGQTAELCDGLDNDCSGTADDANACPSDCTGFTVENQAHMFCRTELTQEGASNACAAAGMRLVWIESESENQAIYTTVSTLTQPSPPSAIYIGATDAEQKGRWHWIDGSAFWQGGDGGHRVDQQYVNWNEGEPNDVTGDEACGAMWIESGDEQPGTWNDVDCGSLAPFVCEAP